MSIGNNVGMNQNFLSDYASIKNGSYARLMKSYYGTGQTLGSVPSSSKKSTKTSNVLDKILEERKNPKVSKNVQEANENLTKGISNLKSSVSALQSDGTYTNTENGQSAADKVVSAMKTFVSDYNNVVNSAKGSTLANKTAYVANMMGSTAANADKLEEIGIRVNARGNLELNEAKLKAADLSKVQELFSPDDMMSYGSMIASRVQFAGSGATTNTVDGTTNTDKTETEDKKATGAAGLKEAGNALASGELYKIIKDEDGNETYDIDKIFATAKSFVNNYNKMFDVAGSSTNSGVMSNLFSIRDKTARNADALKEFGISVDAKGKMQIDEDTFKKADMSKVQKFFKDYGSAIATNASLVDFYMTTQANTASGYTAAGKYNVQGSNLFADFI
ncbi:MAG: hypothetical protein HFH42_04015 [Lachnospiraceae bacterium]|jgi:hypothetical protein|nr:hypothetical protein [Lachnospiraceae bacterium]